MSVIITFITIILCILGLCGLFTDDISPEYWTGLLTFIIGVWMPHPSSTLPLNEQPLDPLDDIDIEMGELDANIDDETIVI